MEIRSIIGSGQGKILAAEVMSSRILRRTEKIEALQWRPKDEFDSPRQMPSAAPTSQIKREKLVL